MTEEEPEETLEDIYGPARFPENVKAINEVYLKKGADISMLEKVANSMPSTSVQEYLASRDESVEITDWFAGLRSTIEDNREVIIALPWVTFEDHPDSVRELDRSVAFYANSAVTDEDLNNLANIFLEAYKDTPKV